MTGARRHLHLVPNDSLAGEARAPEDQRSPAAERPTDHAVGDEDVIPLAVRRAHPSADPHPVATERAELLSALSTAAAALHRHLASEPTVRDPWRPEDYASARRLVRDIIQVDRAVARATLQSRALQASFGWVARQQMLTDSSTSLESLLSHLSARSTDDPWERSDYETALAVLAGMRRVLKRLEELCERRIDEER